MGMIVSLKSMMNREDCDPKARQLAKEIYQNIMPAINVPSNKRARYDSTRFRVKSLV